MCVCNDVEDEIHFLVYCSYIDDMCNAHIYFYLNVLVLPCFLLSNRLQVDLSILYFHFP